LIEYAGWVRRLGLMRRAERRAAASIAALEEGADPIFFFPLQLDCDYQMRLPSPFRAMHLAIDHVLTSFCPHPPDGGRLVGKLHPLDSGLYNWTAMIGHLAVALGIADRVTILDGGDLAKVLARSRAVVTVNSTVGTLALALGLPVVALGKAIYDVTGLTFQGK